MDASLRREARRCGGVGRQTGRGIDGPGGPKLDDDGLVRTAAKPAQTKECVTGGPCQVRAYFKSWSAWVCEPVMPEAPLLPGAGCNTYLWRICRA